MRTEPKPDFERMLEQMAIIKYVSINAADNAYIERLDDIETEYQNMRAIVLQAQKDWEANHASQAER